MYLRTVKANRQPRVEGRKLDADVDLVGVGSVGLGRKIGMVDPTATGAESANKKNALTQNRVTRGFFTSPRQGRNGDQNT
jgi:hypothetical protein